MTRISSLLADNGDQEADSNKEREKWLEKIRDSNDLLATGSHTSKSVVDYTEAFRKANSVSFVDRVELSRELTSRSGDSSSRYEENGYYYNQEDEHLNPGSYLLPVKDPLFTVRLREYRRNRYEKVKQIETLLFRRESHQGLMQKESSSSRVSVGRTIPSPHTPSPPATPQASKTSPAQSTRRLNIDSASTGQPRVQQRNSISTLTEFQQQLVQQQKPLYTQKIIKERYHIDQYGRCVHRGSLSRFGSLRSTESKQSSRLSHSPSPSTDNLFLIRQQPSFRSFTDSRNDKRLSTLIGEGSSPLIREKLKDMYLLVGEQVLLRCRIDGNPPPRCFWYHNDRLILGDDDRYKFAQTDDGWTTLSISKARVSDIGVYRCAARNQFGLVVTNARLSVGDTPDRPSKPIVAAFNADQVYLVWDAPAFNGNSDILCYKVDFKIADDVKWSNAAYTIHECCLIKSLKPSTTYRFRVSCINSVGVSSYSWASEEIVTNDAANNKKLVIDYEMADKLLEEQYNLEKRQQQLMLVKKPSTELVKHQKRLEEIIRVRENENPADLYQTDRVYCQLSGGFMLGEVKDVANQSKKLIKSTKDLNESEMKILRELKEQDGLLELVEVFHYDHKFTYIYSDSIPILEFIAFKHKYSEESIVKILRQLLDAVQWLHMHGYIHLNIHPLSVFNAGLTQINVKLGCLDNAVLVNEYTQSHSDKILSLMPLDFAAPELINNEAVSMATDIWSIGVMAALL